VLSVFRNLYYYPHVTVVYGDANRAVG
jgi:hypothetical protein